MNCQKGDLAILINGIDAPENVGALVRVVRCIVLDGEFCWLFKEASRPLAFYGEHNKKHFHSSSSELPDDVAPVLEDRVLMPVRDPGDDATDEMVLIAGKPQEVTA